MDEGRLKADLENFFHGHQAMEDPYDFSGQQMSTLELQKILDCSPAGIGIVKNRVLGWTNDNFYAMLGYEPGSLQGKNTRVLFASEQEYKRVGRVLYGGLDSCDSSIVETTLVRKSGSSFDCRIRASKLDKNDVSKGIVIIFTDISELKLLQIRLQQAQKMEAIGVLAGGISHDFNNILMGIQGHLSLMQIDLTAAEKVKNHTRHIDRLVKTAAELTSRLLGFARGGKYQISKLDMNELVRVTLNIFKPTRKDIVVQEAYEKTLQHIDGDQSQLEQVILNIILNASQAMPGNGSLFVSTHNILIPENHGYPFEVKPGRYIRITIKDTGVGMDVETQKKIFDPFFSTKEAGDRKGRGLGLSTVFGIVKNHGGFILVESKKGQGARFDICLPSSTCAPPVPMEDLQDQFEQIQKGSETVLLVDDEEDIINVGKNFLVKLGYKPLIARNGLEAVEIFRLYKDEISLVVLDLIMPKMSGKEAFREIKAIQSDARILISTGYAVDDKVDGFLNQGCQGFLQKPFSLNEFAMELRQILDKK